MTRSSSTAAGVPDKRGTVFAFVRVYQPDSPSYAQLAETVGSFATKEGSLADTKLARTLPELREFLGGTTKEIEDIWGDAHTLDTEGLEAFGPDALFVFGWRSYLPGQMPTRFVAGGATALEQG